MAGLFISYRRQDSAGQAGRLRDALAGRYGNENVFHDITSLVPGQRWAEELQRAAGASDVIVVVLGPQWLDARAPGGERRIDDPYDFVRAEVGHALRSGKTVVPVLVAGATLPQKDELPDDLRGLVDRQAVTLTDQHWDRDLRPLLDLLDSTLDPPMTAGVAPAAPPAAARAPAPAIPRPGTTITHSRTRPGLWSRAVLAYRVLVGRQSDDAEPRRSRVSRDETERPSTWNVVKPVHPARQPPAVFVSYSSLDQAVADELVAKIEDSGHRCWISHRDIPPGSASYAEPIVTAIANSRMFVALLTATSNASIDVLREVTIAADEKIPILGITLDGSPLSPGLRYFLSAGQRLDVTGASSGERAARVLAATAHHLPAI